MATRAGDLVEPRHIERLRMEVVESFAAALAYPPFFDFRTGSLRTRPIDRAKMAEIEQFIGSATFEIIARSAPTSPETRRYIEGLALRYLEVNPSLATAPGRRYLSLLRTRALKLSGDIHRQFTTHVSGGERNFGARRQAASWTLDKRASRHARADSDHISRVLESAIAPHDRSAPGAAPRHPASSDPGKVAPSPGAFTPPPPSMPSFPAFGAAPRLSTPADLTDQPTGPLESILPPAAAHSSGRSSPSAMRELPADLLNLYGDYLGDLEPETRAPAPPPQPAPRQRPPAQPIVPPPPRPPQAAPAPNTPNTGPADPRGDQLIFWQLRYQLEAYVRLAARSYGLPGHGGDPASVLDELRRSGFVDEADLRIAEGVFALTDRVTAQGSATTADYRQALMLYLLYHRSHINA